MTNARVFIMFRPRKHFNIQGVCEISTSHFTTGSTVLPMFQLCQQSSQYISRIETSQSRLICWKMYLYYIAKYIGNSEKFNLLKSFKYFPLLFSSHSTNQICAFKSSKKISRLPQSLHRILWASPSKKKYSITIHIPIVELLHSHLLMWKCFTRTQDLSTECFIT